jgi:hypothetical protein
MKKIYIAGAISSDNPIQTLHNISKGLAMGAKLLQLGYAPFVPHMDTLLHFMMHDKPLTNVELWYTYSLEWLKVSDAVLVLPEWEKSKGVKREIEVAVEHGIPIYSSLAELSTL